MKKVLKKVFFNIFALHYKVPKNYSAWFSKSTDPFLLHFPHINKDQLTRGLIWLNLMTSFMQVSNRRNFRIMRIAQPFIIKPARENACANSKRRCRHSVCKCKGAEQIDVCLPTYAQGQFYFCWGSE